MPVMATVIILVVLTCWVCSVSFFPQKCHSMQIYPQLSSVETEFHHVSCPACRSPEFEMIFNVFGFTVLMFY